jgi:hypothetical protein
MVDTFRAQFRDGDLIKGRKDYIFLVIDHKACWIPNKEVFEAMGLNWNAVRTIDDSKLDRMEKGSLIFKNSSGYFYLSLNGRVAPVGDWRMLKALGLSDRFIRVLPDQVIANLQQIPLVIKGKGRDKFLWVNGKICPIKSDRIIDALGLDQSDAAFINPGALAGLIQSPLLLKGPGDKIYLIEKERRRWISSMHVFERYHYDMNTVYEVDHKVIHAIEEGAPIN